MELSALQHSTNISKGRTALMWLAKIAIICHRIVATVYKTNRNKTTTTMKNDIDDATTKGSSQRVKEMKATVLRIEQNHDFIEQK